LISKFNIAQKLPDYFDPHGLKEIEQDTIHVRFLLSFLENKKQLDILFTCRKIVTSFAIRT